MQYIYFTILHLRIDFLAMMNAPVQVQIVTSKILHCMVNYKAKNIYPALQK